jgi:hypothetical protein
VPVAASVSVDVDDRHLATRSTDGGLEGERLQRNRALDVDGESRHEPVHAVVRHLFDCVCDQRGDGPPCREVGLQGPRANAVANSRPSSTRSNSDLPVSFEPRTAGSVFGQVEGGLANNL